MYKDIAMYINYAFNFTVVRAINYNYKYENKTYKLYISHNTVGKLNIITISLVCL